ncbi:unnamed protein product [Prorocentrum cordatum]|uniref:C3H1-type domain-containing protein n=1 Tax=Prorocentrum cordatum TaxID=2364126 RepID=A0ABN9SY94_9DINO|nr:unnamed protein product [Polarella glacialis]
MRPVPLFLAKLKPYQPVVHLWLLYAQNVARDGLKFEKELVESGTSMDDLEAAIMNDEYGVTPEHSVDVFFNPQDLPVPTILAYSEALFPKPHDWPETENLMVVGQMKLPPRDHGVPGSEATPSSASNSDPEAAVRDQCLAFLAAGAAPVYVGWGSMVVESGAWMCRLAVGALQRAGLRGIIVSGWAEMTVESLVGSPDEEELRSYCAGNVLFVSAVSHEWLFPKCICALHHGGIGTLHASLEAGLPTLITPVFADQWDSGAMLVRSGLGAATEKTLRKVTAEELGDKLRSCCEDGEMRARVRRVAAAMAKENAVGTVADWLETFLGAEGAAERWDQKCLARRQSLQARFRGRKHLPIEQVVSRIGFEIAARFPQIKAFFEREQANFLEQLEIGGRGCLFTVVPKSGLLVKEASSLDSRELGRLEERSVVEKLDEKGARWRVRLLDGSGPVQGWISRTVAGKDMMKALSGMKEPGCGFCSCRSRLWEPLVLAPPACLLLYLSQALPAQRAGQPPEVTMRAAAKAAATTQPPPAPAQSAREAKRCTLAACSLGDPALPRLFVADLVDGGAAGQHCRHTHTQTRQWAIDEHGHNFTRLVDEFFGSGASLQLFVHGPKTYAARFNEEKDLLQNRTLLRNSTDVYLFSATLWGYGKKFDSESAASSPVMDYFSPAVRQALRRPTASLPLHFAPRRPAVGVHVRRGDLPKSSVRVVPDEYYLGLIDAVRSVIPEADVHLWSSVGSGRAASPWAASDFDGFRARGVAVHLDEAGWRPTVNINYRRRSLSASMQTMPETNFRAHLAKTKFCSYFHRGTCHYGDQCAFAHFASELQSTPNLQKTRLCEAFLKGCCQKTDCKFAHGKHELITAELFHKTTMCSWHEKGKCRYGDRCRFAHGGDELRPPQPHQLKSQSGASVDGDSSSKSETSTDVPDASPASSVRGSLGGRRPSPAAARRPAPRGLAAPPGLSMLPGGLLGEVPAKPRGGAASPPGLWAPAGPQRGEPRTAALNTTAAEDPYLPVKVYSSLVPCSQPYPHGHHYNALDA